MAPGFAAAEDVAAVEELVAAASELALSAGFELTIALAGSTSEVAFPGAGLKTGAAPCRVGCGTFLALASATTIGAGLVVAVGAGAALLCGPSGAAQIRPATPAPAASTTTAAVESARAGAPIVSVRSWSGQTTRLRSP